MTDSVNSKSTLTATGVPVTSTSIKEVMSLPNLLSPSPAIEGVISSPSSKSVVPTTTTPANDTSLAIGGDTATTDAMTPPVADETTNRSGDEANLDKPKVEISTSSPVVVQTNLAAREFICMNDEFAECKTGQYTKDLSRKVISDHFGRNKACTRLITDWPLFCRKHYQRATYNSSLWQIRKINLILRQFDIIEAQIPGTKYCVVFKKSEESRLNEYSRKVASGMDNEEAAEAVAPEEGKHFEAPVDVLRELEYDIGPNKTITEVKATVNLIHEMLQKEETNSVPSIEFLPQLDSAGKPYNVTVKKTKAKDKTRVSKKGAVKKNAPRKKASASKKGASKAGASKA